MAGARCFLAATLLWLAPGAQAQDFNFTNQQSGLWSDISVWVNGAASAPTNGGGTNYIINFNNVAADFSTNDLWGGGALTNFYLNQLNFGGANVFLTTTNGAGVSNFVFSYNTDLPQINQNTWATSVVAGVGFILETNLLVGGTGGGAPLGGSMLALSNIITGAGGLIMNGAFTLRLGGNSTYTGGTLLSNGIIQLTRSNALGSPAGSFVIQVYSNAALDLNGNELDFYGTVLSKTVFISGMGLGPNTGAVFSTAATANNKGLGSLLLGSDSAIGGSAGRMDIAGTLNGGGFTLYKVGSNQTWMAPTSVARITNLPLVVVNNGLFGLQTSSNLLGAGQTVFRVFTNGVLGVAASQTFTNRVDLRGGTFRNVSGANIWNGLIGVNGLTNIFDTFGGDLRIGGAISGAGQVVKVGTNVLTLSGNNTYSGGTIVSNGLVIFSSPAALPATPVANAVTLGPGGGVAATGAYDTVMGWLGSGKITPGTGGFIAMATNNSEAVDFTLGGYSDMFLASMNEDSLLRFEGSLTPVGTNYGLGGFGRMVLPFDNMLTNLYGSNANLIVGPAGSFLNAGYVMLLGANTYGGITTVNSNQTLSIGTTAHIGGDGKTIFLNGGLQIRGATLTGAHAGLTIVPGAGADMALDINNNGNTFVLADNLTGPGGSLNKLGSGTLVLTGTNGLTGALNIRAGVLRITNGLALAGGSNLVFSGAALQLAATNVNRVASGGNGNNRRIVLNGSGVDNDGALRIVSGTFITNYASIRLASAARINVDAGGTLIQAGIVSNFGNVITFGGFGDFIVSNRIGGSGGLVKDGAGTLTLRNATANRTNSYGSTTIAAGTFRLDFANSIAGIASMLSNNSALTLGSSSFSITTGGVLNILGPSGVATIGQWFNGLTIGPGNNRIVVSNNAGSVFLNLSNITRAVGGGALDLLLPGGSGAITTILSNNNAGLLGQTGAIGGNVLATVGRADWAMATNFTAGSLTNKIVNYVGYVDRAGGDSIASDSNSNVRLIVGGAGNITLGASVTAINSLAATTASARTIDLAGQMLRMGQTAGILLTPTSGGLTLGSSANDGFLTAGGDTNTAGELVLINYAANAATLNASIISNGTGPVTVTVNGNGPVIFAGNNAFNQAYLNGGTVTFSGTNTIAGAAPLTVRGGTTTFTPTSSSTFGGGPLVVDGGGVLNINGPFIANTNLRVGVTAGARAVVNIGTNLLITSGTTGLQIGSGGAGAVYQTGGVVTITSSAANDNNFGLGNSGTGYGYYQMTNGALSALRFSLGVAANAPGVFEMIGGTVTIGEFIIHRGDAPAVLNVFGGQLNAGNAADTVLNFDQTGYGVFNVRGPGVANLAFATNRSLNVNGMVDGTGTVNILSGGTLIANRVYASDAGTAVVNFDGGMLVANSNGTAFGSTFLSGLSGAYIHSGGATFDSPVAVVAVTTPLDAPTGFGLTNIAIASGGSGYIGAPVVVIGGGSGSGASAIAQMDPLTGALTNILITSRGSGYFSNDVLDVRLLGGGPIQAAQLGAFTFGTNTASGGLTKNGLGGLALAATNSYVGATVVNAGSLTLATTNQPGLATLTLAGPTVAIGTTYALDQDFLNWLDAKIGAPIAAVVLGADSSSNLVFTSPNLAGTFLGGAGVGPVTYSGAAAWGDSTLRLGGGSATLIYAPVISGGTNVVIGPAGGNPLSVVVLSTSNDYTGGTIVTNGTLKLGGPHALGTPAPGAPLVTLAHGAGLGAWGNFYLAASNAIVLNGGSAFFDTTSGNFLVDATVTGTGALVKVGVNTLTLLGTNNYGGGTILSNGTVSIGNEWNVGGPGSNVTFAGGTLQIRGLAMTDLDNLDIVFVAGGLDINNNGNRFVITNDIDGVSLTKSGQGLLVLGGDNSSSSLTGLVVQSGPVLITNGLSLATLTNLVQPGGALWFGSNIVTAGQPLTLNGGGALAPFGGASVVGGDGALRNIGGLNTNAGPITLASAARINADSNSTLFLAGAVSNGAFGLTIGGFGDVVVSTNILGTGGLTKDGSGTLTLQGNATNAYGNTVVGAGTLRLDYNASTVASNLVAPGSTLTLGTTGFSITTGGALVVSGPAAGAITQSFGGFVINAGNNAIVLKDNGNPGGVTLNLDGITRAVGGGIVDLSGTGVVTTTLFTNYAGLLSSNNVLATFNGTDWATVTNSGGALILTNFTDSVDVTDGSAMPAVASNQNVRIIGGGAGGNVTFGALTEFNALAVTNPVATTNDLAGGMLRLGQTGGILVTPGSGGLQIGSAVNDGFLTAGGADNTAGELVFINNSANPLTVNSVITSNGTGAITVTVNGNGAVNFAGDNAFNQAYVNAGNVTFFGTNNITGAAPLTVRGGTVTLAAGGSNTLGGGTTLVDGGGLLSINGSLVANTNIRVGVTAGSRAVMTIGGEGSLLITNTASALQLGFGAGTAGAFYQTGGIVNISGAIGTPGEGNFNPGAGGYGYYRITNGLLLNNGRFTLGGNIAGSIAVFEQSGGVVTNREWVLWRQGPAALMNLMGGEFNANNASGFTLNFGGVGYDVLNIAGANANLAMISTLALNVNGTANATGIVNLLSGTLIVNQVTATAAGQSLFNFDGGTLKANPNGVGAFGPTFMPNVLAGAYIYDGGATIDTSTNIVSILTPLLAPAGFGLTNIAIADSGLGYIGTPIVSISGGNGVGATAVAQVDLDPASARFGQITNILITSAGSGYLSNDALNITLLGGGAIQPAQLGTFLFGTNTGGGLTKTGDGILYLLATNTYTGGTLISAGSLGFGLGAAQGSVLGDIVNNGNLLFNHTNELEFPNSVNGIGSIIMIGSGVLILSGTNTYAGGTVVTNGVVGFLATNALPTSGLVTVEPGAMVAMDQTNLNGQLLPYVAQSSGGALGLLPTNAGESFNFNAAGPGGTLVFTNLSLGGVDDVTYTGIYTPYTNSLGANFWRLAAYNGVTFTFTNEMGDGLAASTLEINKGDKSLIGTVVVTANNTFSGGTFLGGGTLRITNDNALGLAPVSPATNFTFQTNATLQFGTNLALNANRAFSILAGTGTFDTLANSTAFIPGTIGGDASMNKIGPGALVLDSNTDTVQFLTVNAGTLWLSNTLFIATGIKANGAIIVGDTAADNNATMIVDTNSAAGMTAGTNNPFTVGNFGSGNTLIVTNGGVVRAGTTNFPGFWLGNQAVSSNNTAIVIGTNSLIASPGRVLVGDDGSFNTMRILDGGTVSNANFFEVGRTATASNNLLWVSGQGALLTNAASGIIIGESGIGNTAIITNGARVVTAARFVLGFNAAGTNNSAFIGGAGTVLEVGSGGIHVGTNGSFNTLVIGNGAVVSNVNRTVIGGAAGATGNFLLVTDSGTYFTNGSELRVGDSGSRNTMVVSNGASAYANSQVYVGALAGANSNTLIVTGPGSRLENAGTRFTVGLRSGMGNGVLVTNGGLVVVRSGSGITGVGYSDNASNPSNNWMTVAGGGSVFSNAGVFVVGGHGSGNSLLVAGGGAFTNLGAFTIGLASNAVAGPLSNFGNSVTVTGGGLMRLGGALTVGLSNALNTLAINNGGVVGAGAGIIIGASTGATDNLVLVDGAGSVLSNASSGLRVGNIGSNNRMIVTNGGVVNIVTFFSVGSTAGATNNTLWVTDSGSVVTNLGNAYSGEFGSWNVIQIANTGRMVSGTVRIGGNAGANSNRVVVTGAGSVLMSTGNFGVGWDTAAVGNQLSVNNGGAVFVGGNLSNTLNSMMNMAGGSAWLAGHFDNLATNNQQNDFSGAFLFNGTSGASVRTQQVEIASVLKDVADMANTNFFFGTLQAGDPVSGSNAFVQLVDNRPNTAGAGSELLAVSNLIVATINSVLDLNDKSVFA
ncbi:MAG: autotransporter-associated beta strand repeat-containing protein, partial [Verrucomicrobia bacterium]|nr:autotransporter-associated beta strand repeat-containing protein [Verrucomicrobiota bacterium]